MHSSPLGSGLPPLGYAENFILYVNRYKSFTKDNMKCTILYDPPGMTRSSHVDCTPLTPYDLILAPLGKNPERNPAWYSILPRFGGGARYSKYTKLVYGKLQY